MVAEPILPIVQVGNEHAYSGEELIYILTKYLAGRCDGAHLPDGVGFNKLHAKFGHALADTPFRFWSDRQLWAARKMLVTYSKTQLAPWWSLVPEVLEPSKHLTVREQEFREYQRKRDPTWQPVDEYRRLALKDVDGVSMLALEQSYDATLLYRLRQLPQSRELRDEHTWVVPLNLGTLEAVAELATEFGYDFSPEVETKIVTLLDAYDERMQLSHAKDGEYHIDLPDGLELYPFQRIGVQYAEHVGNVLFADQMGLGKTVEGLVTALVADAFPILAICTSSTKGHWAKEAMKWLPDKRVAYLSSRTPAPLRDDAGNPLFDIFIINYDVLSGWKDEVIALAPKAIIADECHKAKNPGAARSKALLTLTEFLPSTRLIFMSGTPVVNRPEEFWSMIRMLGYSDAFGGYGAYQRRYCGNPTKARLEELNTLARSYFMIRRLKKDVLPELPDKQYVTVPIDIDNRREYERAELDIAGFFAQKAAERADSEQLELSLMREAIKQDLDEDAADAYVQDGMRAHFGAAYWQAYEIASRNEELLRWEALKQLAVKGKMKAVEDWIDEFLESDEKLVIFGTHTDVILRLAHRYNAPYIRGGVKALERTAIEERFQTDPTCKVLVGNMQAMGEGLNLQASCSHVCFVEFGWNPKDHDQAEDRLHRIGQKDSVTVWHLAAEGTIDEEIIALIEGKREVVDAIQDGGGRDIEREMMDALRASLDARMAKRRR